MLTKADDHQVHPLPEPITRTKDLSQHLMGNRVNKAASKSFMGNSDAFIHDMPMVDLRPNQGNYHEKSVRNCYDALALDFDEFEED